MEEVGRGDRLAWARMEEGVDDLAGANKKERTGKGKGRNISEE